MRHCVPHSARDTLASPLHQSVEAVVAGPQRYDDQHAADDGEVIEEDDAIEEIGRASCRERV